VIDLHTHILPGIDDGVKTEDDAVEFAKVAAADGVTTIVATPHYRDGFYVNTRTDVLSGVERLRRRLAEERVPVTLLPGAEIHICPDLVDRVRSGHAPTLADNGRTVLFELSMTQYPFELESVVYAMRLAGLQVLFAHPERIRYFQEDIRRYEALVHQGAFGQITTGSVLGVFGDEVAEFSEELIRKKLVHVVASDAHNVRGRPPILTAALARIGDWVGADLARRMATEIPQAFLEGKEPNVPPPEDPRPRRRSFLGRLFGKE
jgi:protein-tyrosine phosphatase